MNETFINSLATISPKDPLIALLAAKAAGAEMDPVAEDVVPVIEEKYLAVRARHESAYAYDGELVSLAMGGLELIMEATINDGATEADPILATYLTYRRGGFSFFMGYADETYEKCIEDMEIAAKCYGETLVMLRDVAEPDETKDAALEAKGSMGEAYSKMVHYATLDDVADVIEDLPLVAEQALELTRTVAEEYDHPEKACKASTWWRNYACACERASRILDIEDFSFLADEVSPDNILRAHRNALEAARSGKNPSCKAKKLAIEAARAYLPKYLDYAKSAGVDVFNLAAELAALDI